MEEMEMDVHFSEGQEIEVGSNEEGFKGSWYSATVLHGSHTPSRSASKMKKKLFVQYETLMKEDQGSNPLTEYVELSRVRPKPPPEEEDVDRTRSLEVDEEVEAFYNDGWWEGCIMQVLGNQKYRIYFKDSNEEIEFQQSEIRVRRKWIGGRWVRGNELVISVTPHNESRIRSPRPARSSQTRRNSSKVENQSTTNKTSSTSYTINSSKKKKMRSSPKSATEFSRPCKKLKTVEGIKTQLSLIACPGFTTPTIKGKRTKVVVKRKKICSLAEFFLDLSLLKGYSSDHPKLLNTYQPKPKHGLGSNGSRNHPSVQGCSSLQLPPNITDVEQLNVVGWPTTKVPVRRQMKLKVRPLRQQKEPLSGDDVTLQKLKVDVFNRRKQTIANDSCTKASVKGGKPVRGRSQAPAGQIPTQTIGPEDITPSRVATTLVVQREDTSKETKRDGALSDITDSHQPLPLLVEESFLPPIIGEKGVSSDNQPTVQPVEAINWEDEPLRGLELQKPSNVVESSFSLECIAADTEMDVAVRDEHIGCVMLSSLPFVKFSPVWEIVDSLEVFRFMPQKLHFRPLEQYNPELREGLAISSIVTFANLVESMGKTQLEDPVSILQDRSKVLEDLEVHGFNVEPIQARLKEFIRIKHNEGHLFDKLMSAEKQMGVKQDEKDKLDAELVEIDKEMREGEELINQLKKKLESAIKEKEIQDSKLVELVVTRLQIRQWLSGVGLEFDRVAAAAW